MLETKEAKLVNPHHDIHDANRLAAAINAVNKLASKELCEEVRELSGVIGKLSVRLKEAGLDGVPETFKRYEELDAKIQGTFDHIDYQVKKIRQWQASFLNVCVNLYGEEEVKQKIERVMKNAGKK